MVVKKGSGKYGIRLDYNHGLVEEHRFETKEERNSQYYKLSRLPDVEKSKKFG